MGVCNWKEKQETTLAKTLIVASQDPIKGNSQTGDAIWETV